jgi:hypothetical protein
LKNRALPVVLGLFLSAFAAQAHSEVLLDCNTSIGPDQQVLVIEDNGQLFLRELTNIGGTVQRVLTSEEWSSQKLSLRAANPGEKNTLTKTADGWYIASRSAISEFGFADCR